MPEPGGEPGAAPEEEPALTPAQPEVAGQQALGLTPDAVYEDVPEQVQRIRENARKIQEEIGRLRGVPQFAEDDDAIYLGSAWGSLARRERDAVVQPPRPEVVPASPW